MVMCSLLTNQRPVSHMMLEPVPVLLLTHNRSVSGDWAPPHSASHPQLRFTLAGRVTGTLVPLPDSADTVCTLQPPVNIPQKLRWTNWRFEQKLGVLS